MGALLAKENIWYVGTQDPNLRVFDIIMHSDWGTSYNAYLVKGSEKTALFETSKLEFFDEFLANVREVCDPASIDYIVVDHTEPDHSGSLEKLLALAPNATVLGSATALNFLKQIVNHEFACRAVTEKDTVDLGGMTLHFLKKLLITRGATSLRIAALMDKPARRVAPLTVDYSCFQIPDAFVVGYGLDYNERYRNLPDVGVLSPRIYAQEEQ